ncbi:hypothetical protein HX004_13675 [Myroides sp. 1354]|uniref:hypothetical protein n=1 Tax=unclassified Myroides TaxID=2642485 RepID=UPI0025768A3D|nr:MULTISPECIES: hypothetical protein [unclassified Myroides]MDM1044480.1 hypothetical protein [Myroides sp. R163-1]MDM1056819.1 hypothetical protein [Myroides sp. 1354]MDM1069910.1 hypothetical protein [Myroides sp. 1372]
MKYAALVVLFFFVNFIATPTIAVLAGIELDIPMLTISEENKKPITNAEEEEKGHFHGLHPFQDDFLFQDREESGLHYAQLKLVYESLEFDVLSPPPEFFVA